jgi:DNA-binding HxlR family transcriptional regulator
MTSAPSSVSVALSWLLPVRSAKLLSSCKFLSRSPYPLATLLDGEMDKATTFFEVPLSIDDRNACLGANGSVQHVTRVLKMISGRWKLPILFRLFAEPSIRTSQLMRDIDGVSQKMLTQHLRELERDGLVQRLDLEELPPRVEYSLTGAGRGLMPLLMSVREFSRGYPTTSPANNAEIERV